MIKTITKKQVIEALEKEPVLESGSWFRGRPKSGCAVCAVGAVLRKVSFEKWARRLRADLGTLGLVATNYSFSPSDDLNKSLKDKNWLGTLSIYFERGHSREKCIAFVKKHFPSKFTLEIKARDVR